MAISDTQLATWSSQAATATAKVTHERVRQVIEAGDYPAGAAFDTFLQGSYRNDTNIRGDSDVDIVTELQSSFIPEAEDLPSEQKALLDSSYADSSHTLFDFLVQVDAVLAGAFGRANVVVDNKCIRVRPPGLLPCDVVVANQYRRYGYFYSSTIESHVKGIRFYALNDKRWVVNYPKVHYANGVAKNSDARCGGRYKPAVRMMKNARTRLVDSGRLPVAQAPSYFVECLLYNVPDAHFAGTLALTYLSILTFLIETARNGSFQSFRCQNEQLPLFGDTPEQWNMGGAVDLLSGWIDLWQSGG